MTLTRSKNSHSELHICGPFMISWPTVFLPDGAYVALTLTISILQLVGSSATLIVIDTSYH
jgi:hypothetical protein